MREPLTFTTSEAQPDEDAPAGQRTTFAVSTIRDADGVVVALAHYELTDGYYHPWPHESRNLEPAKGVDRYADALLAIEDAAIDAARAAVDEYRGAAWQDQMEAKAASA